MKFASFLAASHSMGMIYVTPINLSFEMILWRYRNRIRSLLANLERPLRINVPFPPKFAFELRPILGRMLIRRLVIEVRTASDTHSCC